MLDKYDLLETDIGNQPIELVRMKEKSRLMNLGKNDESNEATNDISNSSSLVNTAMDTLNRIGISSRQVRSLAETIDAEPLVKRLAGDISLTVATEDSHAYCRYGPEWGVWINLDGRQSDGIVPEDEYELVRSKLIDLLAAVETPNGERVFTDVKRREDVFSGPRTDEMPDVMVFPKEHHCVVGPGITSSVLSPSDKHDHYMNGVFIGAGSQYQAVGEHETMSLTDVAPIVCSLLGIDIPERMTGSIPEGLLENESQRRAYGDVPYGSGIADNTADDVDEVTDRLENLGYL